MKYYKYKMNMLSLNIIACILLILLLIIHILLFKNVFYDFNIMIYAILWMFLHEIIHGLTFMSFREVEKKNVVFGAKLESGIFYCMCKQPISKKVILTSLLSPLVLIGVVTLIVAIIFDLSILGFLSLINIGGCIGDIMMTFMFLRLPKDIKYTDLDDCEGFVVLSNKNLIDKKFLGFNLIENGKYNDEIKPKEFKKINVTKISWIILIIILLLFIVSLF